MIELDKIAWSKKSHEGVTESTGRFGFFVSWKLQSNQTAAERILQNEVRIIVTTAPLCR